MVSSNGIHDVGLLFILLSNLGTEQCVRQLALLIRHLADVVKQSGTLGLLRVQTQLSCHHRAEVGCLAGMLKQVLSIRRAIFHLSNYPDELRMESMNTQVYCCTLTRLNDFVVKLFLYLGHNLLNTCGMDTAVSHQLVKRQTAYLTADRIKSGDNDAFRRVVNDNLDAAGSLQSTDVTSLTTNDTAFHLIVVNMKHADRSLNSGLGSNALNGLNNNLLSLHVGIKLGLVNHLVDIAGSIHPGLVLHAFHQAVLGFFSRQARQFLELGTLLLLHLVKVLALYLKETLLVFNALLLTLNILFGPANFLLTLVKHELTLLEPVLHSLHLLVAQLNLLIQLIFLIKKLLFDLKKFFLFDHIGIFLSLSHLFLIDFRQYVTEYGISSHSAHNQRGCCGNNYTTHLFYMFKLIHIPSNLLFPLFQHSLYLRSKLT